MEFRELPVGACFHTVPGADLPGEHLVKVSLERYKVGAETREGISLHQQVVRCYPPIAGPLSPAEVRERTGADGVLRAVLAFTLDELLFEDAGDLAERTAARVWGDAADELGRRPLPIGVQLRVVGAVEGDERELEDSDNECNGQVLLEATIEVVWADPGVVVVQVAGESRESNVPPLPGGRTP